MRVIYLMLLVLAVFFSGCRADKYISNRFAGTYEITAYTSELWDSTGKISSQNYPCNYKFYLSANVSEFDNAPGKLDTSGVEPSFITVLGLDDFGGLDRFTFKWNMGTSDNDRLSLLKSSGLVTRSVIVKVERNALGRVNAFTYFRLNGDGTYYFDKFDVVKRY